MKVRVVAFAFAAALCMVGFAAVPPAPAQTQSFTFGAAGDFAANSNTTATLSLMGSSGLNFALAIGDLSYDAITPESAWCSYVQSKVGATLPFELISGNHESDGSDGLIDNFAQCLPDRIGDVAGTYAKQYYFDYPPTNPIARVIMVSPGLTFTYGGAYDYSQGSANYTWVSNTIDSARAAGIKWIIVGMHKVCLTTGSMDCDMGPDLLNLLVSKHVDLILEGHDHDYQRSKQLALNAATCPSIVPDSAPYYGTYNSSCVVNSGASGVYTAGAGTVIVIDGTGGTDESNAGTINTSRPNNGYFAAWMGANVNPRYGFVKYTVSTSSISAQFLGSTSTSSFSDSFSIQSPSTTPLPSPTSAPSPTTRPTSAPPSTTALFANSFDTQATGSLLTGTGANQFTGMAGSSKLSVQSGLAHSPPNALSVTEAGGGSAYAYTTYAVPQTTHVLQFNVQLGGDFSLPSGSYALLAETGAAYGAASSTGEVDLTLTSSGAMHLDWYDATGTHQYVYGCGTLVSGNWHTIALQETVGSGTGSLAVYMDGAKTCSQGSLNTGVQPVDYFSVGNIYTPNSSSVTGHVYIDDVSTALALGAVPATVAPALSPTATATAANTPAPTKTVPPTPTNTLAPAVTATTAATASPTATPSPSATPTLPATPTATLAVTATATTTTPSGSIFADPFDAQGTGALALGAAASQFTGTVGASQLAVENTLAASPPNALSISAAGGGTGYAYKSYASTYTTHVLRFSVQLGSDFHLATGSYLQLTAAGPSYGSSSSVGKVELTLTASGSLHIDWWDASDTHQYIYGSGTLSPGGWHTFTLAETVGSGNGSITLLEDGTQVAAKTGLNTGGQPIGYVAVGDLYSPSNTGTAGHVYIDGVSASTS